MAEMHVVTALKAKRAELAGDIELTARRLQRLKVELQSLDTTLCLFDPSAAPETIEAKLWRPKADWAKRGEMSTAVLDMLRVASEPMSTRDMALAYMTARGHDTADERLLRLLSKRIGCCLRGKRDQGLVASEAGPGQIMLWRIESD